MKYLTVWLQLTKNSFQSTLSNRIDSSMYLLGKLIRFVFFWVFLVALFDFTPNLAGYTKHQALLFFLTFNLVDVLGQAFFRGIYVFKWDIRRGTFDGILTKPINSLFYIQSKLTDLLDFLFLIPIVILIVRTMRHIPEIGLPQTFLYVGFVFFSILLVLAIHTLTAGFTIRHTESDNIIWLYRETMTVGRFPPEIYSALMQFIFTFCFPILVIVSYPVKSALGLLSIETTLISMVSTVVFFVLCVGFWKSSIKKYSSASS